MKTKTKKKIINFQNQLFDKVDEDSIDVLDLSKELLKIKHNNNKSNKKEQKESLSLKDCIRNTTVPLIYTIII